MELQFKEIAEGFLVANENNEYIGDIIYYKPWKKFVFNPSSETVFDAECLGQIKNVLEKLYR